MRRRNAGLPTDVYRVFNADGELIYVGIAMNVFARMKGHRQDSAWWHHAVEATVDRYPDRRTAKTVESRLIAANRPAFNIAMDRPPYPNDFELAESLETLMLFWEDGQVWVDAEQA